MKRLGLLLVAMLFAAGSVRAAPPDTVWLTVGDAGWQVLQRIDPLAWPQIVQERPAPLRADGTRAAGDTLRVVGVSAAQRDALAGAVHRELHHCGGFMAHDSFAQALAWLDPLPLVAPTRPDYVIDSQELVLPMLPDVSSQRLAGDITALSAFHNRYYDSNYGAQAAAWLVDQWQTIAAGRSDIQVETVYRGSDAMPSVVLSIAGSGLADQVLVLGAHLDSINWYDRGPGVPLGAGRAPGADDDASGVAGLTEVLRVLVAHNYHPRRSIRLMAYSGEEMGLYGSAYIAADYAARNVDVVGVVQMDMTNYAGSVADIYLVDDQTDAQQNAFLEDLGAVYLPALVIGHTNCGYACSDHASWTEQGYAASFPFEAAMGQDNPYIHSRNDTLANSDTQALHARKFTRLALAWLVELSRKPDLIFRNGFESADTHL